MRQALLIDAGADGVVSVHLSAELSGTVEAALMIADLHGGTFAFRGSPTQLRRPCILAITGEWSQRSGLTTFTLVPHRGRVIAAKAMSQTTFLSYYYALEVDGEVYTRRVGHFATFPRGPSSFMFAFASSPM